MKVTRRELESIVENYLKDDLQEGTFGAVGGGVNITFCDLSRIPELFHSLFSAIRDKRYDKIEARDFHQNLFINLLTCFLISFRSCFSLTLIGGLVSSPGFGSLGFSDEDTCLLPVCSLEYSSSSSPKVISAL